MTINKKHSYICIYCRNIFSDAPAEHILQNSLSTTRTCKTIMCSECQSLFGGSPDTAIAKFSDFFRNRLNIGTGRKKDSVPTLKDAKDDKGNKYVIKPGFKLDLQEPIFSLHDKTIQIEYSRNAKGHEGWAKSKVKNAGFELGKAISKTVRSGGIVPISLEMNMDFGFICVALLKSAMNLIGYFKSAIALDICLDDLRNELITLKLDKCKKRVKSMGLIALPYECQALFAHQLFVYSRNDKIEAVVRLFGGVSFIMLLSEGYSGEPFTFSYISDPLGSRKDIISATYHPEMVDEFIDYKASNATFSSVYFYENVKTGYGLFMNKTIIHDALNAFSLVKINDEASLYDVLLNKLLYPLTHQIYFETLKGTPGRLYEFISAVLQRTLEIMRQPPVD